MSGALIKRDFNKLKKMRVEPRGKNTLEKQNSIEEMRREAQALKKQEEREYHELKKRREAAEERRRRLEEASMQKLLELEEETKALMKQMEDAKAAEAAKNAYNPAHLPKVYRDRKKPTPLPTLSTKTPVLDRLEQGSYAELSKKIKRPAMVSLVPPKAASMPRQKPKPKPVAEPKAEPKPAVVPVVAETTEQTGTKEEETHQEMVEPEAVNREEEEEDGVLGKVVSFVTSWWS